VDAELAEAARKVLGAPDPGIEFTASLASPDGPEGVELHIRDEESADVGTGQAGDPAEQQEAAHAETTSIDEGKPFRKKRAHKLAAEVKPGEVVISRRLYRSGQSEYLINGRAARLRDVQELFMGIGLGPDSYAIIEQGRIGQVLSSKPSDRRAIIEEAAGITKFKTKKRLAEAKLESSKLNLSRVNDIYVEIEKQLASLKRQASKARRYAELREQMRGLLRQVLASKVRELDAEAERLERLVEGITASETERAKSVNEYEGEQERLDRRTLELDAELRQHHNLIGQAALEIDRAENRVLFNRQRVEQLLAREQEVAGEREQASGQIAQLASRVAAQTDIVARLRDEAQSLEGLLSVIASRSSELAGSAQQTDARMAELRLQISALDDSLAQQQAAQAQAEQSAAHHAGALERLEQSERQLLEESLFHRDRSRNADIRWQSVNDRSNALVAAVRTAQEHLANLRQEQQTAAGRCESLRAVVAGAHARRQTLEQILNDRSYTAEAVQKLFAAEGQGAARDFRAVGVLADYAEVEPRYEGAVEQFLRDELEYVVVETFDHARAGIAMLREEVGGRATFFVDSLRQLNLIAKDEPVVSFASEPALVSRLDRLLEFRDPLGPAAKQFLPRLQSAFLVESAEAAERLARENPAYNFLMPDGTCYQGRAVTGGRPAEAGPLVMKRELRALEAETLRLEGEASAAQAALETTQSARQDAERGLEEITAQQVEMGKTVVGATLERDSARAELARLGMELATCQNEIERIRREAQSAQQRAASARAGREDAARTRFAAELELNDKIARVAEMRQAAQVQHEELATRRAEKAGLDERLASAVALAARIEEEHTELLVRAASLVDQEAAMAKEREQLLLQNEQEHLQTESLRAERQRLEARKSEIEQEADRSRARIAEVDDALRTARQHLTDLREERGRFEVERARNDSEREHLRALCFDELHAQPEDLMAEQSALLGGQELAAADQQYRELKERVESMGPVNMLALEEYNECEQRFTFMGREREDLLQSIADTQQAIAELDQVSRQKFEEAFAAINAHFATAFQTLFGGGTGQMRLSEPDSAGDAGIDIAAQPPGKRLQNVLLLSGGEKALTALALLIAIFRYQPSPFCILDEVDAPLDETNVGRFAQMVSEMSSDAQFIVVTHNRRTMEMAQVLYGVTMQEPGVSKLVSVSWDQARAAAASNAA
jgi:chromosome segregation protein